MAISILPPSIPQFTDADKTLFERYQAFIENVNSGAACYKDNEWLTSAKNLSADLHSEAMRLGVSRAHEFSTDIYWLDQCAAIVSVHAFGQNSSNFERYKKAVHYYRNFESTSQRVLAFDRYVQSLV